MLMRFWKWNSKKRIWKNRKWIWEYDYSRIEADDLSDRIHALLKKQGIGKDDHENGDMVFQLMYDRKHLTEEHANEFMALVKSIGDGLFEGKAPVYTLD